RARFVQEAKLTASLEHPNIVGVHDLAWSEGGEPFYTMRFVEGCTLSERVKEFHDKQAHDQRKPIGMRAWLHAFIAACHAVAYAHSRPRPVIHRDLKPDNVMLGPFGEIFVEELQDTENHLVRMRILGEAQRDSYKVDKDRVKKLKEQLAN